MIEQPAEALPSWEAEWTLFGPIPNEGNPSTWPGKLGWSPLPLDGATEIPAEATLEGRTYRPTKAFSEEGRLDFGQIFNYLEALPQVYMMLEMESPTAVGLPLAFSANWGTVWWLNGEEVYHSGGGNLGDPQVRNTQQFVLPLPAGKSLLVVRFIAGGPVPWSITMGKLPPRQPASGEVPAPTVPLLPPPPRRWTRDYAATSLRIEDRPAPEPVEIIRPHEQEMADLGVQAHWIGIADDQGSPYGTSEFLPQREGGRPEDEELMREQVKLIHAQGMAAITWFPGMHCGSAAKAHPDWQVVPLGVFSEQFWESNWNLCPLTPWGEALTNFTLESMGKYDLDGFWFDGSTWSHPGKIGCACEYCRRRFREDEGLDFPVAADWSDPAFQRWVAWRFRAFMDFYGQLADRVRRAFPRATIIVNHLHRLRSSWHSAIPVDRYAARVMVGSESQDSLFESAFHGRLAAAYGQEASEVWMSSGRLGSRTPSWPEEAHPVYRHIHHSLAAITAGSWPCYGGPGTRLEEAATYFGSVINPRQPYAGGQPEPYVGLHLSQQADTLYFSRFADWEYPLDYWESIFGWDKLLAEKQMLTRIAFDAELTRGELFKYPVFLAPLSVALSDAQVSLLTEYVASGGVLLAGPSFGACDEYGNVVNPARVRSLLGHDAEPPAGAEVLKATGAEARLRRLGHGQVIELTGNAGLVFNHRRSAKLADEIAGLISRSAPPRVQIEGPRRLHVGLFRRRERLYLHVQNFMAWSESGGFPDPAITAPEPAREVRVTLRGLDIHAARQVTAPGAPEMPLARSGDAVTLSLPVVEWQEIVELEV
jgi:hypothetical protein